MPHYKDPENKIHWIDSDEFIHLLPVGSVQISDLEADAILNQPLTIEQKAAAMESAVQKHLDDTAKLRGYDGIMSACTYAGATNPFQAESQGYIQWRGSVWAYCYQALADVQAGTRTIPTDAELIAELPALVLP